MLLSAWVRLGLVDDAGRGVAVRHCFHALGVGESEELPDEVALRQVLHVGLPLDVALLLLAHADHDVGCVGHG